MNQIFHSYKPKVIVPYVAIVHNIGFLNSKEEREIITSDGIKCKAINIKEKHICELEQEIKEIYNMDCWQWLCRWHKAYPYMQSMLFVVMDLRKI